MRPGDVVILNIQRELQVHAAPGKIPPNDDDNDAGTNVHILFKEDTPIVRFIGVTHDDIHWSVDIDFRDFTSQYYAKLKVDLGRFIDLKRAERQKQSIPENIQPADGNQPVEPKKPIPQYLH